MEFSEENMRTVRKKLAIITSAFLARGKLFSAAFIFVVFLNLAIVLQAVVFTSIWKTAPLLFDYRRLTVMWPQEILNLVRLWHDV